jgi:uncharacterized membrane protein (DUF4010 family)
MSDSLPQLAMQLLVVLGIGLLIGAEREHDQSEREEEGHRQFGGVRTFPLIALAGYLLSVDPFAYTAGLLVLGGLLGLSYRRKSERGRVGLTTEMAALVIYGIGPIVQAGVMWLAVAAGILTLLLLQLKQPMERLVRQLPDEEIFTFTQFALVTAVVLPLLPDRDYTQFAINPFRAWLVVVAVASISYLSYLLQRWRGGRSGLFLAAVLGGAYSSTATTVALARQARVQPAQARILSGAVIAATGMMYLRLIILIWLFAPALGLAVVGPFLLMAIGALAAGSWSLRRSSPSASTPPLSATNPLQLGNALLFAAIFVGIEALTWLATQRLGEAGLFALAAIMGTAGIDPFILSVTQHADLVVRQGALAVAIAVASNNLFKGLYAWRIGGPTLGRRALGGLALLAGATVLAIALAVP